MTDAPEPRTRREEESGRAEAFLERFFAEENDADSSSERVKPFLDNLRLGTDAPIVLPRYRADTDDFSMYVIARSPSHVAQVRELIAAFAGPTYSTGGDTSPESLDPQDPVDAAVIDFAQPNTTFVVRTTKNRAKRADLRKSLELMQSTIIRKPTRSWPVTRPLGRLIAEFEAALASGGEASSKHALDQIVARGGISATNLAHLRIKRLDRLGLSRELLALGSLNHVLKQDPPRPVKEAVLNAIYSTAVAESLSQGDVPGACDRLRETDLHLPVSSDVPLYGDEAVTVLVTAAVGRNDIPRLELMISKLREGDRVSSVPDVLWHEATELVAPAAKPSSLPTGEAEASGADATITPAPSAVSPTLPSESPVDAGIAEPESWADLFRQIASGFPDAAKIVRNETWRSWSSPAESDEEVSQALGGFDDLSWSRAWETAGAVIEALGYGNPAPNTVREFITYALTFDKLSTGDLITLHALTEIFLRSAPSASAYRLFLEEMRDACVQWVSPENAVIALDFADRLVLAACPDENARLNCAIALLTPLHRYHGRLEESVLPFAIQLSEELSVPLEWVRREHSEEGDVFGGLAGRSVLLYSLDESVLKRTEAELQRRIPDLKITRSHDKVGSPQLKQKARNADVIALATRCAKHAATGFISEHGKTAQISYADGSGSASLLRAAMSGLLASKQNP